MLCDPPTIDDAQVARTGGLEWHMKTAHGLALTDHAKAAAAAAAAAVAIVPFEQPSAVIGASWLDQPIHLYQTVYTACRGEQWLWVPFVRAQKQLRPQP